MSVPENVAELAALEWLKENTTLEFTLETPGVLATLPGRVQLFVAKFCEIMDAKAGIASQSIEGLSLSYAADKDALIWSLAHSLLGGLLKSQVTFYPATRKW